MSFLEEHNYSAFTSVSPGQNNMTTMSTPVFNIKMECISEESNDWFENRTESNQNNVNETNVIAKQEIKDRRENDGDNERSASPVDKKLSDLEKATIFQTCINLLDSSSSDDDELILLWLLCKNKKKLRKKRQI